MKKLILITFLAIILFSSIVLCKKKKKQSPPNVGEECVSNAGCYGQTVCIENKCDFCKEDNQCGTGDIFCIKSICKFCLKLGEECENDSHCCGCGKDCKCLNGKCRAKGYCETDANCNQETHYCNEGYCHEKCQTNEDCVIDGEPVTNIHEICFKNKCKRCQNENDVCENNSHCCNGHRMKCIENICKEPPTTKPSGCKPEKERCTKSFECCDGKPCKVAPKYDVRYCGEPPHSLAG